MQGHPVFSSTQQPTHTYPSPLNGQSPQMQYVTQQHGHGYPSTMNGTPNIGQSLQMQYGTQHGRDFPSTISGTLSHSILQQGTQPYGTLPQSTQLPGTHPQGTIPNSTTPYGAQPQGALPHSQSPHFQQTNMQMPAGHTPVEQRHMTPYNEQAGAYGGQRLHAEGQGYTVPDDISHKTPSPYDTLTRINSKVPAPVLDDSRGNYTQLNMQDPSRPRLEPGSTKPPVVEHEDYSHLTHGPHHGSKGSGDQMAAQSQQRPPQQVNQELPQQNVRPNQYRPKSDSVGESSSTISVSSDSHYSGSDIRPQITVTTTQQGASAQNKPKADTQRTNTTSHDESKNHVDNAKQELVNGNDDYLIPTAETGGKDSKLDIKTPGRNSKLPISSRTEPFSSEGEEEDEDEKEEEDEDSAALRSALQEQLDGGDTSNPVVRIEVTKHESPKEQGKILW